MRQLVEEYSNMKQPVSYFKTKKRTRFNCKRTQKKIP